MIFRNWVLQNFPFLEDEFDALTDYELFCKMVEYMKESLKKVKDFQGTINEFTIKLNEFQHWFDNLDVTEEVNAKLDEMVEDGTMEELIAEYLQLQTTYTFNNVEDLKEAQNLVNGMFVRTSGYYSYNDGGGAYYKIRNVTTDDTIDDMFIIELSDNTIIAEYIIVNNELNIKSLGCKGDSTFDNTEKLQAIIDKAEEDSLKIIIPNGNYLITDTLFINSKITIEGQGDNSLWSDNTIYPCILSCIDNKPVFHISLSNNLYNWDTAHNNLVENVHFKNFRLYGILGNDETVRGLTGIYANTYLSSFENMVISGFYNDISLAGCYETIVDNCQFMNSYQQIVLFNNNDTTLINNTYCNGSYNDANSVISDTNYINRYTKNHMLNYCNLYSNNSYCYFYNLAIEKSCYSIISRDSDLYGDIIHIEAISDCAIYNEPYLKTSSIIDLDHVSYYNQNTYSSCILYNNKYLGKINIKTINALPISNFNDGTNQTRTINRLYSYKTGENIIPLTLSDNVIGATIVNNSHYTETGFKVDYLIDGATTWTDNIITKITGLPVSNSFGNDSYILCKSACLTKNESINFRLFGNGNLVYGDNSWLYLSGGSQLLKYARIETEYKIT